MLYTVCALDGHARPLCIYTQSDAAPVCSGAAHAPLAGLSGAAVPLRRRPGAARTLPGVWPRMSGTAANIATIGAPTDGGAESKGPRAARWEGERIAPPGRVFNKSRFGSKVGGRSTERAGGSTAPMIDTFFSTQRTTFTAAPGMHATRYHPNRTRPTMRAPQCQTLRMGESWHVHNHRGTIPSNRVARPLLETPRRSLDLKPLTRLAPRPTNVSHGRRPRRGSSNRAARTSFHRRCNLRAVCRSPRRASQPATHSG